MSDLAMLPLTEPPDLLRRFAPTPHEACIQSGDLCVRMRTNEARLLRLAGGFEQNRCEFGQAAWTMICDPEMPAESGNPLVLDDGTTSFLSFGRSCYVVVDHQRNEVIGFVSAGISDEEWVGVVLPAVLVVWQAAPGATKGAAER